MLYAFAHFLRDKMPWLWDLVDILNFFLFNFRYGRKVRDIESRTKVLEISDTTYTIVPMRDVPTEQLVQFFAKQPEEAYKFFKPHRFDAKSINKLQRNKAFLGYVLIDNSNENLAGYCFNRSFFHGKGFRGRMVDIDCRGQGLGTAMNKILNDIGFGIGLRLFETVSKDNVASYRSALSAGNVRVVEEMEHNELYLEILPE